ncbi:MAG: acyl carrier protein [Crocosphaera sp.]
MENQSIQVTETTKEMSVSPSPSASEIQLWLVNYLTDLLEVDSSKIDTTAPFTAFGLNSLTTAGMASDLAKWLGKEISPDSAYEYPTIEALANHLAAEN